MSWLDFAYSCLLLLIPILLAIMTFRELEKNNRLGNLLVLFLFGVVIVWWGISFFFLVSAENHTMTCWAGIIICAIARLLHGIINREKYATGMQETNEDAESIKRLISILMALFSMAIILCIAIMIISRFLPS
jgi:hypothetical protein